MIPTWLEARKFITRYGETYETVKAGVGLAECAARTAGIIKNRKPDLIILAGFAGAYPDRGISKGETVLVERENSSDLGSCNGTEFRPLPKSGLDPAYNFYDCPGPVPDLFRKVVSNSVNIAALGRKNDLLMDGEIENMEGAAFFAVCRSMYVPFLELRTISNIVGDRPEEWLMGEASEILSDSLATLLDNLSTENNVLYRAELTH